MTKTGEEVCLVRPIFFVLLRDLVFTKSRRKRKQKSANFPELVTMARLVGSLCVVLSLSLACWSAPVSADQPVTTTSGDAALKQKHGLPVNGSMEVWTMAVLEKQFSGLNIDFTGRTPIDPQTVSKLNSALHDATYLLQECNKRAQIQDQTSDKAADSSTQQGSLAQSRRLLLPWINGVSLETTFDGSIPADVSFL